MLDGETRLAVVRARVTTAEKVFVQEQAAKAGLDESDYVRRRILGLPVSPAPSRIEASLLSELNRIGVNVNQLARAANSGQPLPGNWNDLAGELAQILAKVSAAYGA